MSVVSRLASAAVLLAALPAPAAVQLDAQARDVSFSSLRSHYELFCPTPQSCSVLSSSLTPDSGSQSAAGFAPFDAELSSAIFPSVSVVQHSTLTPSRLAASASHAAAGFGSLSSGAPPGFFIQDSDEHTTASHFRVDFTLDAPTAYALRASAVAGGAGFVGATSVFVELRRASGEVLHRIALQDDDSCFGDPSCSELGPATLDELGTLAAGSYVLEAALEGQSGALITTLVQLANSHTGSFEVELQLGTLVPLPAPALALGAAALLALARRRLRASR
jgi:hypothetical protein